MIEKKVAARQLMQNAILLALKMEEETMRCKNAALEARKGKEMFLPRASRGSVAH